MFCFLWGHDGAWQPKGQDHLAVSSRHGGIGGEAWGRIERVRGTFPNFQMFDASTNIVVVFRLKLCQSMFSLLQQVRLYPAWKHKCIICAYSEVVEFKSQTLHALRFQHGWHIGRNQEECLVQIMRWRHFCSAYHIEQSIANRLGVAEYPCACWRCHGARIWLAETVARREMWPCE